MALRGPASALPAYHDVNGITPQIVISPLPGIPLIEPGDDLASAILSALQADGNRLQSGDVLVVTSKIVSKAEGRIVNLADVVPSAEAVRLAEITGKDPRLVELVLRESVAVSRVASGVLVTRHRLGFTAANAGVDQSNVERGDEQALLLPIDPDASAAALRERLRERTGIAPAVVISDSQGRPFRMGGIGVAVGVAGMPALVDLRGQADLFGRVLKITLQAYADLVASAAQLVTGEGAEGWPVVLVRGLRVPPGEGRASDLYRKPEHDLYA